MAVDGLRSCCVGLLALVGSAHAFSGIGRGASQLHTVLHGQIVRGHSESLHANDAPTRRGTSVPQLSAAATAPSVSSHTATAQLPPLQACQYDHLQFFVDHLQPLSHYKAIEDRLNTLASRVPISKGGQADMTAACDAWRKLGPSVDPAAYEVHGRDLVEQLLHGFGWRITGMHEGRETRSLLLSTVDPLGARFIVTCFNDSGDTEPWQAAQGEGEALEPFDHFGRAHVERYFASHNHAQGIAVLGFEMVGGSVEALHARYEALHPKLIAAPPREYADGTRILDVFAYYVGEAKVSDADQGTLLRFVERRAAEGEAAEGEAATNPADDAGAVADARLPLPGLESVAAAFEPGVLPAYSDHWVSNVVSRVGFLQTLEETLGFVPKVDFNAGVVAAGEAQIESTVTGNTSPLSTADPREALCDRAQVFLPTNNALSPVGHVHWYLEELGQGVQHIASRVESLPEYVQRANDMREITGEGFTFLNIPRTYYGLLETALLTRGGVDGELLSAACPSALTEAEAAEVVGALRAAGFVDRAGAFSLDASAEAIDAALATVAGYADAPASRRAMVQAVLRRSCYVNLWKLMGDQLDEATYLSIVRNKILIDVQGEDVLMQIFTSVVLQRQPGTEAPFLEFIQRVCAQCSDGPDKCAPIRPGCGGFGIRNFLTLFLSIEVSKAMLDRQQAEESGQAAEAAYHGRRVEMFTEQLVEANPILTEISDCMTGEGRALGQGDAAAAEEWARRKEAANGALAQCSQKYNALMGQLREAGW